MFDWFNLVLLAIILAVTGFIAYAIRMMLKKISKVQVSRGDALSLARQIRERRIHCPRCYRQSSALLATDTKYKCDSCHSEFEGPPHL